MILEYRRGTIPMQEVRAGNSGGPTLVGYAALFDHPSQDLGGFVETIKPGAFRESLETDSDHLLLWDHDSKYVLAGRKAGSLRLKEDARGLRVEAWPGNERVWVRDVVEGIKRNEQTGMSFGFYVKSDRWETGRGSVPLRVLERVRLLEVSLVSFPAYSGTHLGVDGMMRAAGRKSAAADWATAAKTRGRELELLRMQGRELELLQKV